MIQNRRMMISGSIGKSVACMKENSFLFYFAWTRVCRFDGCLLAGVLVLSYMISPNAFFSQKVNKMV